MCTVGIRFHGELNFCILDFINIIVYYIFSIDILIASSKKKWQYKLRERWHVEPFAKPEALANLLVKNVSEIIACSEWKRLRSHHNLIYIIIETVP